MISKLLRDKELGKYLVPIVPDEARTFGMDGLFPQAGIYSPEGQNYEPVDAGTLSPYKEAKDGQILQEGICEAGALASFMAAGTAYAHFQLPMIPFYIFYSIFEYRAIGITGVCDKRNMQKNFICMREVLLIFSLNSIV